MKIALTQASIDVTDLPVNAGNRSTRQGRAQVLREVETENAKHCDLGVVLQPNVACSFMSVGRIGCELAAVGLSR